MKPNPFRRQHGTLDPPQVDTAAFRPFWRSRSQLDKLRDARAISPAEHQAGTLFRNRFELAFGKLWGASRLPSEFARTYHPPESSRPTPHLDSVRWIRQAQLALGDHRSTLLTALLIDDPTWVELAQLTRLHRHTVRARAIEALQYLARNLPPAQP